MINRMVTVLVAALTLGAAVSAWACGPPTTAPGNGPGGGLRGERRHR